MEKNSDCVHVWVTFSIYNVALRVSTKKLSTFLPGGVLLCVFDRVFIEVPLSYENCSKISGYALVCGGLFAPFFWFEHFRKTSVAEAKCWRSSRLMTGDLLKMAICSRSSFTNFPKNLQKSWRDKSVKVDQITHLLSKKGIFSASVNTRNPLNIFQKTSDVCRSSGSLILLPWH